MPRSILVLFTLLLCICFATLILADSPPPLSPPPLTNVGQEPTTESPPPADRVVRWQTAYWSIVAVALNAMTQPSGADRHLVTAQLSPARSSPIVCLADILVMFIWSATGLRRGLGLKRSLGLAAFYSTADDLDTMGSTTPTPTANTDKDIPAVGLMFFVLAPLTQFVKLCGMRGVPITQTLSVIYMIAYFLSALLSLFPRPQASIQAAGTVSEELNGLRRSEIIRIQKHTHNLYRCAIAIQCIVWIVLILSLSIVVINPKAGYLITLFTAALIAVSGCMRQSSYGIVFFLMFYLNIILWLVQANVEKHDAGDPSLGKPKAALPRFVFYCYLWVGNVLLMTATVLAMVGLCGLLLVLLDGMMKWFGSLAKTSRESNFAATPHTLDRRPEADANHPTAHSDTPVDSVAQPAAVRQDGPGASTVADVAQPNRADPPLNSTSESSPSSPLHDTLPIVSTPSIQQQTTHFNFAEWLESDTNHSVGEIGEIPPNPRPYGFHIGNRVGIERAKARGDPYWAASAGGPATAPPPGTVYLSAAQIATLKQTEHSVGESEEHETSSQVSVAFAMTNLVIGLLCYAYKYDAVGTVKPDWTELLG